jgi:hypothetical protein
VTISANAAELIAGYEAMRAQALGTVPATAARGLSVLVLAGMPAWMRALAPTERTSTPARPLAARESAGFGTELVSLLTDMVLTSRKRCYP